MNIGFVILFGLSLVVVFMAFAYIHIDLGRKMMMWKVIGPLQTWIPVHGVIREIKFTSYSRVNAIWCMNYIFTLEDGRDFTGKAIGSVPRLSSLPYNSGEGIDVLVDPGNPGHSRTIHDLRRHSFLVPRSEKLKSVKRLRTEFAVDCLLMLACAVAAVMLDKKFSYTPGAGIMLYLFYGVVMIVLGMLQMIDYAPKKLLD